MILSTKGSEYSFIELHEKPLPPLRYAAGQPIRKSCVFLNDIVAVATASICFALALVVVYDRNIALRLGQTNQLIAIGFLLTIMTYCSSRHLKLVCLTYEVYAGRSTIQSFDAILRNEGLAEHASWPVRAKLAFVLILSLSLRASYKLFSGGSSTVTIQDLSSTMGLTGAIGLQRIGNGISLMAETYVPYWVNAESNKTYGYNMYVESNTTTALLDAPPPDSLMGLMASMNLGESLVLTADR